MKKAAKKTTLIVMMLALLLSQSACLELFMGRYQTASSNLAYLTNYQIAVFASLFVPSMLLATNPLLIQPGSKAPLTAVFPAMGPTLLTHSIMAAFSTAYIFNGFGAAGTVIGQYRILDPSGNLVRLASIIALSNLIAYIDLNANNTYDDSYEPQLAWQQISLTTQALLLTFPLWAGGMPNQAYYNLTDLAALTLFAGILSYPLTAGSYPINWTFTAIDPQTGGKGTLTRSLITPVAIGLLPPEAISLLTVILGLQMLTRNLNTTLPLKEYALGNNPFFGMAEILYIMSRLAATQGK